jgi:hypothetical protein
VKYMLLIYGNDEIWSSFPSDEFAELVKKTDALIQELRGTGEFVDGFGAADAALVKQVRTTDGTPVVSDGPYLETKEYLASFWIVDCESEARALEIAARNPASAYTAVEMWPLMHEAPPAE